MKTAFEWIDKQGGLLCGLCSGLIGLTGVLGWALRAPWLGGFWTGYAPMQINTAIGLAVAGAGLSLIERRAKLGALCGGIVTALGTATLLEYALRINGGFDSILYPHTLPAEAPTRMAVNTAVCFLVAGAALVFASAARRISGMWTLFAGYATLIIAGSALTGYALGLEFAYRWASETRMSIFTGIAFVPLGAGLFKFGWQRVTVNRTWWLTLLTAGLVAGTSMLTWVAVDAAYRRLGQPPVVPDLMLFTALTRCCVAGIVVFLWRTNATRLNRVRTLNTSLQGEVTERNAQLRVIFDAVKVGTWTHDLTTGQAEFDGYGHELFGLSGHSGEHRLEDLLRTIHPEDRRRLRDASRLAVERQEAIDVEFRVMWPDGSAHWILAQGGVSKYADGKPACLSGINLDITRLKNAEHALQESEAAVRKLNQALERRIRIQTKELVDSEKRFRLMVEGLQDYAFFMLDTDGRVVSWNKGAERIIGYAAEEIVGKHFSILCTPEEVQRRHPEEQLQTSAEQGRFEESGWRVRRDGARFWAHVLVTPVHDDGGDLCGFSTLIRDITERKHAQEEIEAQRRRAEDANQAKSRFLASMSHEIRTPMNAILGMTDLLWETDLDEEQRHYVEIFRRAGVTLMDLINDILDLSKIESGRLKLERVEFSVEQVVADVAELLTSRAQDKGIGLRRRVEPGLPERVIGDAGRLRQVLVNLVGNAIKFTNSGEVVIAVEPLLSGAPGEFKFLVTDTGIGIPSNKLASIFEPFEQADASTARKFGGTGLGLSICQRLIACMGGTLAVESEQGRGSTFHFTAKFEAVPKEAGSTWRPARPGPRNEAAAAAEAQPALPRGPHAAQGRFGPPNDREFAGVPPSQAPSRGGVPQMPAQGQRGPATVQKLAMDPPSQAPLCGGVPQKPASILVAEDSADNRFLIEAYLKSSAYHPVFASDGRVALQKYQEQPFDVVLMDMEMPVMDGLSAARAIREFEASHRREPVPILALTANAHREAIEECRRAGCTSHVAKPVSKAGLLRAIEEALSAQPLTRPRPEPPPVEFREAAPALRLAIPEGMEALAPRYLSARRKELPEMVALLAAADFDQIGSRGHNMKGTGRSYGFPDLTEIGAALERSAKHRDKDAVDKQLMRLANYLESVQLSGQPAREAVS